VYRIEISPRAAREIRALPRQLQVRISARLTALANDPRPPGTKLLSGEEGLYRIRVGDYRVVYAVEDDVLLVLVVKVGHRRDVYQ